MSQLLSQASLRIRLVLSSMKHGVSGRRLYVPGLALLMFALLGASTNNRHVERRTAGLEQSFKDMGWD